MKKFLLLSVSLLVFVSVWADVQLPKIFGDHMVLQRDQPILIWGWAKPKEKVIVQLNQQTKSVVTGKDGKWRISLAPESAGGPYTISIKGKNSITLNDVLIGEVWVCSGQSNMEWTVRNSNNALPEIAQANFPQIRQFKAERAIALTPQEDVKDGNWKSCTPETAGDFTAVGYYFARELHRELGVPIGLINTTWGGTHVETWTSKSAFENSEDFKAMIASLPNVNLDTLAKRKAEAITKRIEGLHGPLGSITAEQAQLWKETATDDAGWRKMRVPGHWEQQELGEFDGVVWFRKTFTATSVDAGKEGVLELGMIDDSDDAYVNGVKVGSTQRKWNEKRVYSIPANIIREGKNAIAVRVIDNSGNGGFHGAPEDVKITFGRSTQPLAADWNYKIESINRNLTTIGPNTYPTLLFNAMVNPIIAYGIKGAIWYQGETNSNRGYQYRKAFPLMISDWRKQWGQGDFPFYFVQLATYNAANGNSKNGSTWAELREAQTMTLSLPNTGMAVTTDIGDPNDIHPRNKQDVGKRLAAVALNRTYGKTRVDSGPVFQSMKVEGSKVVLSFANTGGGLVVKDKYGYLKGFEIAGEDKQFQYAKAFIDGDKVVIYQEGVDNPVAVRFGWADDSGDNNLFNKEGFPAVPFRTDNWKGITEEAKFHIRN